MQEVNNVIFTCPLTNNSIKMQILDCVIGSRSIYLCFAKGYHILVEIIVFCTVVVLIMCYYNEHSFLGVMVSNSVVFFIFLDSADSHWSIFLTGINFGGKKKSITWDVLQIMQSTSLQVGKSQGQNSESMRDCSHPGKNNFLGMKSTLPDCCLIQKSSHRNTNCVGIVYAVAWFSVSQLFFCLTSWNNKTTTNQKDKQNQNQIHLPPPCHTKKPHQKPTQTNNKLGWL